MEEQNDSFGGGDSSSNRQIAEVIDCSLIQTGQLTFDHEFGTCATNGNVILLCFNDNYDDYSKCREAAAPLEQFTELASSAHDHYRSRIASSDGN